MEAQDTVESLRACLTVERAARRKLEEALLALTSHSLAGEDDGDGSEPSKDVYTAEEWQQCMRMLWTTVRRPEAFPDHRLSKVALAVRALFDADADMSGETSILARVASEAGAKRATNRSIKRFKKQKRAEHDHSVLDNTVLRKAYLSQLNQMRDTLPPLEALMDTDAGEEGGHIYLQYRETSHAERMLEGPASEGPRSSALAEGVQEKALAKEGRTAALLLGPLLREDAPPMVSVRTDEAETSDAMAWPVVCDPPPVPLPETGKVEGRARLAATGNLFFEKTVLKPRKCQICKAHYFRIHFFYGNHFCPECSLLNWEKRNQTAPLEGRVALLTGGRKKIGFEVGLLLLRWGAELHVTTRFPVDCTQRYSRETDFVEWRDRLHVYRLDLRIIPEIEAFCAHLKDTLARLDIIINNAAQTVSRPQAYFYRTIETEQHAPITSAIEPVLRSNFKHQRKLREGGVLRILEGSSAVAVGSSAVYMPRYGEEEVMGEEVGVPRTVEGMVEGPAEGESEGITHSAEDTGGAERKNSSRVARELAAQGRKERRELAAKVTNDDEHFVDLKKKNSWLLDLHEVSTAELLEVHAINSIAPFILVSRLIPLMRSSVLVSSTDSEGPHSSGTEDVKEDVKDEPRFVINVSAMEGQFYRHKSGQHPHTNMAKASLNMMTRTCAPEYAEKYGIYMNSVDTGWVTDEKPLLQKLNMEEEWTPPLDSKDGAARVLDPVCLGLRGGPLHFGWFWKDYRKTHW